MGHIGFTPMKDSSSLSNVLGQCPVWQDFFIVES
nr:MAG TPA: hypothetical protein [Caudoviricetes sp.]